MILLLLLLNRLSPQQQLEVKSCQAHCAWFSSPPRWKCFPPFHWEAHCWLIWGSVLTFPDALYFIKTIFILPSKDIILHWLNKHSDQPMLENPPFSTLFFGFGTIFWPESAADQLFWPGWVSEWNQTSKTLIPFVHQVSVRSENFC